ncbi:MAG TPA: 2',3'-cyclic-nucleotide 2'-phosphodiesterase, partial [Haliangium sp.]|nr:2',3'-cyclic-nucleotide 2'-phosphodiesterase [Haliangium sp.]
QVLANYIAGQEAVNPSADDNWSFVPINGTVVVTFETSPAAEEFASAFPRLVDTGDLSEAGYAVYRYDFSP